LCKVNLVKSYREKLQLTLSELSKLTGLSESGLYYIESGKKEPKISTAMAISKALKVPFTQLFPQDEINTKQVSRSA
jgi:DNA-binding XRE family transcriptional regulator